jgi:hypothetical protein
MAGTINHPGMAANILDMTAVNPGMGAIKVASTRRRRAIMA